MLFIQSSLDHFKFIAHAPHGLERPFGGNTLQLFAQALDVNVNRAGVTEIIEAPYFIEKLVSCEYLIEIGCEEVKQLEFLRRHLDCGAHICDLVVWQIDYKIRIPYHVYVRSLFRCLILAPYITYHKLKYDGQTCNKTFTDTFVLKNIKFLSYFPHIHALEKD